MKHYIIKEKNHKQKKANDYYSGGQDKYNSYEGFNDHRG